MAVRKRNRRRDGSCRNTRSTDFVQQMLNKERISFNDDSVERLQEAVVGLGHVSSQLEDLQLLVDDWIDIINEVIEENE